MGNLSRLLCSEKTVYEHSILSGLLPLGRKNMLPMTIGIKYN